MTEKKARNRTDAGLTRVAGQILSGAIASMLSFLVVFLLCVGLSVLTDTVIGIETGTSTGFVHSAQIGWQLQLLSQFVHVRVSSVPLGVAPLLLTLILAGVIAAFFSRVRGPVLTAAIAGDVTWLALTLLVQWSLQSAIDDPWYLYVPKILAVYLIALVPKGISRLRPVITARLDRSRPRARRFAGICRDGRRLARFIGIVWSLLSTVVAVVWAVRGAGAYSKICSLLGMKSVSFAMCAVISLLWAPNMVIWAGVWIAGGTIRIGSVAAYALGSATGSGLPLVPMLGLLPTAVASSGVRVFLRVLVWILPAMLTVWYTLSQRGLGWHIALVEVFDRIGRSGPGEARPCDDRLRPMAGNQRSADSDTGSASSLRAPADTADAAKAGGKTVPGTARTAHGAGLTTRLAVRMIPGLLCLLVTDIVLLVGVAVPVLLSDGSLGTKNLSFIGITIPDALVHLYVPVIIGSAGGWLLTCCICLVLSALRSHGITTGLVRRRVRGTLSPLFSRPGKDLSTSIPVEETDSDGGGVTTDQDRNDASPHGKDRQEADEPDPASAKDGSPDDRPDESAGYPMTTAQSATDFFRSANRREGGQR